MTKNYNPIMYKPLKDNKILLDIHRKDSKECAREHYRFHHSPLVTTF